MSPGPNEIPPSKRACVAEAAEEDTFALMRALMRVGIL
jgi:hypothetical protein